MLYCPALQNRVGVLGTQIKSVCLRASGALNDVMLHILLKQLPNLQELDLGYCKRLTDDSLNAHVPNLRVVDMSGNDFTDSGLLKFCENNTHLTSLTLSNCSSLSDQVFAKCAASLPSTFHL